MYDDEYGVGPEDGWPDTAAGWEERLATDEVEDWEEAFVRGYEEEARKEMEGTA